MNGFEHAPIFLNRAFIIAYKRGVLGMAVCGSCNEPRHISFRSATQRCDTKIMHEVPKTRRSETEYHFRDIDGRMIVNKR